MKESEKEKEKKDSSLLLGLSANTEDNHHRITKGDNFYLHGGSSRTHDLMVEEVLLFNEILKTTGKSLAQLSQKDYFEIVKEVKNKKKNTRSYWSYNFNHFNN